MIDCASSRSTANSNPNVVECRIELEHPQQTQQPQHAKIAGAEKAENGRQHRKQIDQREEAPQIAQPAPERITIARVVKVDAGPERSTYSAAKIAVAACSNASNAAA